jgi:cell division protein FtsL
MREMVEKRDGYQSTVGSRQSAVGQSAVTDGHVNTVQASGRAARERTSGRKSGKGWMKGLISGTFITERLILNNMRYAALVVFLGIILITNKFQAERTNREIVVLEQEVRDLRAESLSVSAELGGVSRQSEIIDLVKERGLGLEELREPPYRIVVNE